MKITVMSNSLEQTKQLAENLAPLLSRGDVITFSGDLGAGKTTFVQGLAKALDVKDRVNSPTFNILKPYFYGRIPLYHIDAYRLEDGNKDIGLEEFIDGDGVTVVEWPQYIEEYLPKSQLNIEIVNVGTSSRTLTFTSTGERYQKLLEEYERLIK